MKGRLSFMGKKKSPTKLRKTNTFAIEEDTINTEPISITDKMRRSFGFSDSEEPALCKKCHKKFSLLRPVKNCDNCGESFCGDDAQRYFFRGNDCRLCINCRDSLLFDIISKSYDTKLETMRNECEYLEDQEANLKVELQNKENLCETLLHIKHSNKTELSAQLSNSQCITNKKWNDLKLIEDEINKIHLEISQVECNLHTVEICQKEAEHMKEHYEDQLIQYDHMTIAREKDIASVQRSMNTLESAIKKRKQKVGDLSFFSNNSIRNDSYGITPTPVIPKSKESENKSCSLFRKCN